MSGITIRKAQRSKAWLKIAIDGVSGSGKTYSSLQIGRGIGDDPRVLLIDTENGSGELYSNLYEYDYIKLEPPYTPAKYVEAIAAAVKNGNDVIIIDSMTHCWKYILSYKESLDATNPKAGFTNWAKAKALFDEMKQALLQCPAHVIATLRAGSEYAESFDSKGNKKFDKVGTKPIAEPDLEYEFTLALRIERSHLATATKDRTEKFDIAAPFTPSPTTGRILFGWLMEGSGDLVRPSGWGGEVLKSEEVKRSLQEAERMGVGVEGRSQDQIDAEAAELLNQKRKEANAIMETLGLKAQTEGLKEFGNLAKGAGLDALEMFWEFSKKREGLKTWKEYQLILQEFIQSKNEAEAEEKKGTQSPEAPPASQTSSDGPSTSDPSRKTSDESSNSENGENGKTTTPGDKPEVSSTSSSQASKSGEKALNLTASEMKVFRAIMTEFEKHPDKVELLKRTDALGLGIREVVAHAVENDCQNLAAAIKALEVLEAKAKAKA